MEKFNSIEEKVIYEKLVMGLSYSQEAEKSNLDFNTDISGVFNNNNLNSYIEEISQNIMAMESTRENIAHRNIYSHRKFIGKFIVFGKKVTRKLLKWYIDPVCYQQTRFNNAVVPSIGRLTEIQAEILRLLSACQERLTESEAVCQERLAERETAYQERLVERETVYQERLAESETKYKSLEQRLLEIESNNKILNSQIIEANNQLSKLNGLDLEVFKDKPHFISVSQAGEDSIIAYILDTLRIKNEDCSYLDLGANHAQDLSNTYMLYKKGARGVLVEANPALIPELKFFRNGDVILNKCISAKPNETVDFYVLNGDGLSTPDLDSAKEFIEKNPALSIERVVSVETITVNEVIEKYLGEAPTVLNIDIEGKEMEALRSIDFYNYRPLVIITEMIEYRPSLIVGEKNDEILKFMTQKGYMEYAFTGINSIFIDGHQLKEAHK